MTKIGIMGGTFDPVHNGHVQLAKQAAEKLDFDRVLFIPAKMPSFKRDKQLTDVKDRVEMVRLAIADIALFKLDLRETRREGISYTADTLAELVAQYCDTCFFFLMGTDAALMLPYWRALERLVSLCTFVVASRPGYDFNPVRDALAHASVPIDARYLEVDTPDISSSELRKMLAAGKDVTQYLPARVAAYIEQHGLYR